MSSTAPDPDLDATEIAVVIVNYRTADLALACLRAVSAERVALPRLRAIVVDGNSGDGSAQQLALAFRDPELTTWATFLPLSLTGGFGWANNQAMLTLINCESPPDFIHVLNPDTVIETGAILSLVQALRFEPAAAAAGSQLIDPNGLPTSSVFSFPTLCREFARGARTGLIDRLFSVAPHCEACSEVCPVDWVAGASVLLRTEALRQVGLFDDGFFLYHEEVELMWRMRRAGWTILHEPRSRVAHVGGAATGVREGRTQAGAMPRRPAYWYQSRRRFFARTKGPSAAAAASALWLAGHLFFRLSRPLRSHLARGLLTDELSDQWRHARPNPMDRVSAITPATASPGAPPAWMEHPQ